ncbi:MAG: radical SAM protein, partial [Bacillota bacterium]
MKPIYKPKGAAKEYGDYAINIYTGCPHRCYYCFAPSVLRRDRELFHTCVMPREGIVEAVRQQLNKERITGRMIHLCFTCDPYPRGYDSTTTREIIKLLKDSGNHVQILTKGDGSVDFDLLDGDDWYGATISCNTGMQKKAEPCAISPLERLNLLEKAKECGIKTWVSFEPVLDGHAVLSCIAGYFDLFDKIKVGKLNYWPSDIDWRRFGELAESVCKET